MSINEAFPNSKGLAPTILVPIEEWDDTTDVILWLYQQKYSSLFKNSPTITLDDPPSNRFEALEKQGAEVKGSAHDYSRLILLFDAKQIGLEEEDNCGYSVVVKRQNPANGYRFEKETKYTIKGMSRKEFEILKEQLLKQ